MHKEPFGSPSQAVLRALREWRVTERKLDPRYSGPMANRSPRPPAECVAGKRAGEGKAAAPNPTVGRPKERPRVSRGAKLREEYHL